MQKHASLKNSKINTLCFLSVSITLISSVLRKKKKQDKFLVGENLLLNSYCFTAENTMLLSIK